MINNVSSPVNTPAAAPDSSQAAASSKTTVQTPFGDMLVDEQSKPDFSALFTSPATAAAPASAASAQSGPAVPTAAAAATPTLESVFGAQPWMANPGGTGPNGTKWNYNPVYFATQATAEKVASMVGGTVVAENATITPGGPFQQTVPNQMIQLADGGTVNAGLIANLFNHGYSQSYIDTQLQNITDGEQA